MFLKQNPKSHSSLTPEFLGVDLSVYPSITEGNSKITISLGAARVSLGAKYGTVVALILKKE
jgi:uncharacterized protein (UPF0210 family)